MSRGCKYERPPRSWTARPGRPEGWNTRDGTVNMQPCVRTAPGSAPSLQELMGGAYLFRTMNVMFTYSRRRMTTEGSGEVADPTAS